MCLKVVIEWWDVTSICIHDVSCSVYFCGINVTRMWHVTPHNERLVFTDKFALRHRNTIQECLTWWKEQETERTMNLLPIITLSENLLHKILAGLSCIVESACSKTWLLILGVFVHILHTLLHISAKHTEAGKAMKATYGNREWRTVFYISMLGWAAHEHYQIEITIHPQLFPFTLGPVFNLLSILLPPTIPFLSVLSFNRKAEKLKGPLLSAMCCLIIMAQSPTHQHGEKILSTACFSTSFTPIFAYPTMPTDSNSPPVLLRRKTMCNVMFDNLPVY